MTVKYSIVLRRGVARGVSSVRITEIAELCNIHPEVIDRFVQLGIVDPAGRDKNGAEWIFSRDAVSLVQKILRLRADLGINYAGIGVVLDLLSRIEQLETRLREMEK